MLHIAYGQGSISKIFLMKIRHGGFYMVEKEGLP